MKKLIGLFILALLSSNVVFAEATVDYSTAQGAFEARMMSRLDMILIPLVGQNNYSINLSVRTRENAKGPNANQIYFSKLGFSARIQGQDPYRYEDDITDLSIDVSISDKIKNLDEATLKTRLEATAKAALPQLKKSIPVTVTSFTPMKTSVLTNDPRLLTPIALVLCAGLIVFGLISAARKISKINFSGAASPGMAPTNKSAMPASVFEPKSSTQSGSNGVASEKFEGIQKWSQWINEDLPAACTFVEKLSRSEAENDLALLAYIFHGSNLSSTKKMLTNLRKESLSKVKKVTEFELKNESFSELDAALTQHITQHFVYQSLDSDHLLQYIHDFTIDESVYITGQNPHMLELFMKYYSTPQMEQIMGWVSFETLNEFLKTRATTKFDLNTLAQQAHKLVLERRKQEESQSESSVAKWLEVASQLDAERELAFYRSLASSTPNGELESVAIESFPQFLIEKLPEKIIKPSLNSYPLEERADYLFTLNEEQRKHYLNFFAAEPRVREVLEIEIEQITADIARRSVIENRREIILKEFNHRIRKYIRSSGENQQLATEVFNKWIAEARSTNAKISSAA
jgi:hypothetical protein